LVCTVFKVYVTLLTAGTCSITASQSGNSIYAAAPVVTQTFLVLATATQPVAALRDRNSVHALAFSSTALGGGK